MIVNSISNSNFMGQKPSRQTITPAHIAAVTTDVHSGYLEQLEALGLINKPMLKKVRKAAAAERAKSTAQSIATVAEILKHPRFVVAQRDNGYWYETEDPHNFRERLQNYAPGKKYHTVEFSREREMAVALKNISENGSIQDYKKAAEAFKNAVESGIIAKHEKTLAAINKETPLSLCTKREGAFGVLKPLNKRGIRSFVDNSLLAPAKEMLQGKISTLKSELAKGEKRLAVIEKILRIKA